MINQHCLTQPCHADDLKRILELMRSWAKAQPKKIYNGYDGT